MEFNGRFSDVRRQLLGNNRFIAFNANDPLFTVRLVGRLTFVHHALWETLNVGLKWKRVASLDIFIGGRAGQKLQASGRGGEGVVTMVNLISMFFNGR